MIPSDIRAVFFDAVGTLIHPEPSAPVIYEAAGRRFGSRYGVTEIAARLRTAFAREEAIDLANDLRTSEERERRRWWNIVGEVLDDVTDRQRCFEELFAHFARPEVWRCDPDAEEVLIELSGRYVLGIASNYDARLHPVVEGHPELRPIQYVVISSEVGWRKPAVQFFEALCAYAGLSAAQVLFVGDDPVNDYRGATAAGLSAVLIGDSAEPEALARALGRIPR